MGLGKDRLVFDTANAADSDNIGAYIRGAGGNIANVTASNELNVIESNLTLLRKAEDAAHASGDSGIMALVVRNDAGTSLAGADGDYSPLQVDANGALRVSGTFTPGDNKAEDAAHSSGDTGSYVLSVRQDAPASSTSADGDYQSFKSDALGRMWVNNSSGALAHSAVSVGTTATDLVATDLANRKRVLIQNLSIGPVFLGGASVTTANGLRLSAASTLEIDASAAVNLHGIVASGTSDVRVFELA